MKSKHISQLLQTLGLLPLLAYPAVLVANAMQAAALMDASRRDSGSPKERALMGAFVAGTTAYPVVALLCRALTAHTRDSDNEAQQLAWSAAPLLFLGVLAALFKWMEKNEKPR